MLKLNTAYAKKVPAEAEYSSKSFHVSMEIELPDGLTPEQIDAKIHENFDQLRNSVEVELKKTSIQQQTANVPTSAQQQNRPVYGKRNGTNSDAPASPKQIKYLLDIAQQIGYTPDQLKARFNVSELEDLTKSQCSKAIDFLNGKAA